MTILHCPHCRQPRLVSTGAFWACANCGYAITQAALSVETSGALAGLRNRISERQ